METLLVQQNLCNELHTPVTVRVALRQASTCMVLMLRMYLTYLLAAGSSVMYLALTYMQATPYLLHLAACRQPNNCYI